MSYASDVSQEGGCSHRLLIVLEGNYHVSANWISDFEIYGMHKKIITKYILPFILNVLYRFGSPTYIWCLIRSIFLIKPLIHMICGSVELSYYPFTKRTLAQGHQWFINILWPENMPWHPGHFRNRLNQVWHDHLHRLTNSLSSEIQ